MSRCFAQYTHEEQVQVLSNARQSAQENLNDEREKNEILLLMLRRSFRLLERARDGRPFKRRAEKLAQDFSTAYSELIVSP